MTKVKKVFAKLSLAVIALMSFPSAAYAQAWMPDLPGKASNLDQLIRILLNTAITLAAVVAVAYLVYNGFKYMMSAGDTTKTEEAQKGIANALIGLVICIVAALVVNFILGRLGVNQEDIESMRMMLFA
ncbi:hypothetical protein JW710_03880 [Candidatus Dojkabacteria bacterium]|nr:hypothetical protein [Candidatus Dojkabacteria bacterium]